MRPYVASQANQAAALAAELLTRSLRRSWAEDKSYFLRDAVKKVFQFCAISRNYLPKILYYSPLKQSDIRRNLLLLFMGMMATLGVSAQDVTIGSITYAIDGGRECAYVRSADKSITSATIEKSISYEGTTYQVAYVGADAFYECQQLTSVALPETTTSIENNAFMRCSALTAIDIPSAVSKLGDGCFAYTGLTSVAVPATVTEMGSSVFYGCYYLTSARIEADITSLPSNTFGGSCRLAEVTLPPTITEIRDEAFKECSSLLSVNLPEGLKTIRAEAFSGCYGLTSLTFPNTLTTIGWGL